MELQGRWDRFVLSGRVEDYLSYRQEAVRAQEHNIQKKNITNKTEAYYGSGTGKSNGNGLGGVSGERI